MFQQEKEYLEDAYSYYQKTGERSIHAIFQITVFEWKQNICFHYL